MEAALQSAVQLFREKFGQEPTIGVAAPGRVNLIGEHIDYCDGFVFPMAIEQCTVLVGKPNGKDAFHIETAAAVGEDGQSLQIPSDLSSLAPVPGHHWSNYIKGVFHAFASSAPAPCDIAIASSVPLGSGLSSSAALEVAAGGKVENSVAKALACQKAEHDFAHVPCGIMDQFISTLAQKGHALLLDCMTKEYKQVPIVGDVSVVVTNSHVKHELVDGEYAKRRAACEEGLRVIKTKNAKVQTWRDVVMDDLLAVQSQLSDEVFRRGRHVISEIERTNKACAAFESNNLAEFGRIMYAGHKSLKDDYNVTVPETDKIVELASEVRGVYGSRMTGGGFGGCVVTLVKSGAVTKLINHLKKGYPQGSSFATGPAQGAHAIDLAVALTPSKPKRTRKSTEGGDSKKTKADQDGADGKQEEQASE